MQWTGLPLVYLNGSDYRARRHCGMLRLRGGNQAMSSQVSRLRLTAPRSASPS